MCDGYEAAGRSDTGGAHSMLDELLCEYVDGTMDPVVREAFEECLRADQALAEEVQRLCCTRELLCRYGCRRQVSPELEARFRQRLACALASEAMHVEAPLLPGAAARLMRLASYVSAAAAALAIGLFVGSAMLTPEATAPTARSSVAQTPAPVHAHGHPPSPPGFQRVAAPLRFGQATSFVFDRHPAARINKLFLEQPHALADGSEQMIYLRRTHIDP